ncbi:hypothetical protein, partial [Victivallis vadensis]|uniref:hypothetical protein n=1 Tax=Victivallis vadensis TaxID=172901 RepID=UPI00307ED409
SRLHAVTAGSRTPTGRGGMTRIGSSYSIINTHSAGNGASDICIAMVTARIDRLVEYCLTHSPDSPEP